MLILVLILCLATSLYVALRRKDSLSLYLLGMSVCNLVMFAGIIVYIAAIGGTAAQQREFLFLVPKLQVWLHALPIPMDRLGYVVAVGRSLFPLFALQAALEATMIPALRRRMKSLRLAACVVPALSLVYYYPAVFRTVVSGRFWLLPLTIHVSLTWIILYLAAAGLLFFQEYHATTMPVFKRNTRYVLLSFASISTLYLLYASKDPAQIYNMFISEYIRLGISSYISGALPALGWIILGLCTVFFVVLGSYNLVRYTQLTYDDTRQDMILKRKFDAAGTGVSVFVHGVKNQLLSSRVLHKKLSRALAGDPPDMAQVRACAVQLNELNEGMLRRMDELYRTVKNNSIALTAVPVEGLVERFHGKYPGQPVRLDVGTDRLVLADLSHLSEAVCNLLCNGYEAAVQAGREEPQVVLRVRAERMWTVLEVEDNGPGIPPERQGKIFEPFVTSKNTNYNWGMGLYYVRKIVRSHLGRLRLESRDGEGARFQIMLPLYDPRQKERSHNGKDNPGDGGGGLPPAAGGLLRRGIRPERYGGGGLRRLRRGDRFPGGHRPLRRDSDGHRNGDHRRGHPGRRGHHGAAPGGQNPVPHRP